MSLQRTQVMARVLMSLVAAAAVAKKAPTRQYKQILPEKYVTEKQVTQQQKQKTSHMVLTGISKNQDFQLPGSLDAEQIASAYLQALIGQQPQQKSRQVTDEIYMQPHL